MLEILTPEVKCILQINSTRLKGAIIAIDDDDDNYIIMSKLDDEWVISLDCYWSSVKDIYLADDMQDIETTIDQYPELERIISRVLKEDM